MTPLNSPIQEMYPDFLTFVLETVRELFDFETDGRTKHAPEDIACATLLMCAFNTSAETVQQIDSLPSADRIIARLGAGKGLVIGEKINHMLKKQVQQVQFPEDALITVAGDITEHPFYGDKDSPQVMGGKHKAGTNYFLKYLTFSLVVKGHRYPVGFYPLTQLHLPRLAEIVAQEVSWLKERGLCDRILLDRGFNDQNIYNQVHLGGTKFLMPLTRNSALDEVFEAYRPRITKRELKKGLVLKGYRPAGWTADYRVVAIRVKAAAPKKKSKEHWIFFITNLSLQPQSLRFLYKQRWGIETAYRQIHTFLPVTTSPNYGVRVFQMGLAVFLFGLWVQLNWQRARRIAHQRNKIKQSRPTVNQKRFKISITTPQIRLMLVLTILARTAEKREKN